MKKNTTQIPALHNLPRSFNTTSLCIQKLRFAAITGLVSLALCTAATAADFSGSLKGVTITDAQGINKPPVAAFTYTITGNTVTLDASGSSDPDGSIASYQWDLGNGNKASGVTTSVEYAPGDYAVTLTVADNANGIALAQNKVATVKMCQVGITIVGHSTGTAPNGLRTNMIYWYRSQATASCAITHLSSRISDTNGPGIKIRLALFTDVNGEPGSQIAGTSEAVTTQPDGSPETLHAPLATRVTLEQDKWYWIGVMSNTLVYSYGSSTRLKTECGYQYTTYSSTGNFPTPARTSESTCRDIYGSVE